jgi:hypothetical protein
MNYLLLGLVAVSLLAGLIAIGVGNRHWSWGTITAAILTLLTACGYLVVASRLAAYEWSWTEFVRRKQTELADVRDALVPSQPGGPLVAAAERKSLQGLADERVRWQRALDRIDSWRTRHWSGCSFRPPTFGADPKDGTVELNLAPRPAAGEPAAAADEAPPPAAEAPAAAPGTDAPPKPATGKPPLDEGATVFLFDERTAEDGGRYLGAMTVKAVAFDAAKNTCSLTVAATERPDAYDTNVWKKTYDRSVTVYDELPSDRWIAFSKTPRPDDGSGVMPPVARRSIEEVERMIESVDADKAFAREVERHENETIDDKDEWKRIRERIAAKQVLPGEYWAKVRLTKTVDELGAALDDEDAKRELPEGAEVEFDLETAFELEDKGLCTIEEVRYRRPLRDGRTLLHGGLVGGAAGKDAEAAIPVDGIAGLVESLRREIDVLKDWRSRLAAAKDRGTKEAVATENRRAAYADDLGNWVRDAEEATRVASAFAGELEQAEARHKAVSAEIVMKARELRTAMAALVARIDAAAPPPTRDAAATP